MQTLRTPDSRFEASGALDYRPNYVNVKSEDGTTLRMHYFDEQPEAPNPVLMLHGEPSWAFIYRRVMRACLAAGLRCLAPDLIGFGRSDKPVEAADHTYERHVGWMLQFIDALDLQRITLLCHDWGGLIGLRLVADHPWRFARVIAANTTLPTGRHPPPAAFLAWRQFARADAELAVGSLMQGGCVTPLSAEVAAAYEAPFPDERYKAGIRQLPALVPTHPEDPGAVANRRAWESLSRFDKPFLTVFGDQDPFTAGAERIFQRKIPGAFGERHIILPNVGHFIQEDAGEELGLITAAFAGAPR
jgi:haloalkane dehalogenase